MKPGAPLIDCKPNTKAKTFLSEMLLFLIALVGTDWLRYASGWTFYDQPDPTHGNVQYVPQANSQDLAYVQPDGTAVMKVDNQSYVAPGGNRRSWAFLAYPSSVID